MHWDTSSTICAIASGTQGAARGVVRISGPSSVDIALRFCGIQSNADLIDQGVECFGGALPKSMDWPHRRSCDAMLPPPIGKLPCHLFLWPTSRSYTGQPSVEIHTLGSLPILEKVQERLCQLGARIAEPGEFTLRSFLAGRLDLTQCEGVLGVIHAQSKTGLELALRQLAGGLTRPLTQLRKTLIDLLADIEAGLDFVDEHIEFVSNEQVCRRLQNELDRVNALSDQLANRGQCHLLPQIAIVGLPNVGKSALVNVLAARAVSIVSPVAGTTRDFLRSSMETEFGAVHIIDTAGLESIQDNSPRAIAQTMSSQVLLDADLILWCIDMSLSVHEFQSQIQLSKKLIAQNDIWLIGTKADLAPVQLNALPTEFLELITSMHDSESIAALRNRIETWVVSRAMETTSVLPTTIARCHSSLASASESLRIALQVATARSGDEFVASEIRNALEQIGMIAGEVYTDDILDALFSRFCIGK